MGACSMYRGSLLRNVLVLLVLQSLEVCGPAILVRAQSECSQDSVLNDITCGNSRFTDCSIAGQTGDLNQMKAIFRTSSNMFRFGAIQFLGLNVTGTQSTTKNAAECCANCASSNNCEVWVFDPAASTLANPFNCLFINSDVCAAATSFGFPPPSSVRPTGVIEPYTFGSGANIAPGRCPDAKLPCKSLTLVAPGADCLVPTPTASDVYDDDLSQLAPGFLKPLVLEGYSTLPEKLAVGMYTYSLTASNGANACSGTITVDPLPLPDLTCPNPVSLQAREGCSVGFPDATTVYGQTFPSVYPLSLAVDQSNDPVNNVGKSLSAGQSYPYTLSVINCGVSRKSCDGTIIVRGGPVAAPACKQNFTIPATKNCKAVAPDALAVYDGTFPLTALLTLSGITGSGTAGGTTLGVGMYPYSLTIGSSCGATSAPCNGTVIVQDSEPLDPNQIACPGVSTILPDAAAATFTATYLGGSSKANGCPVTLAVATNPSGSAVTCDRCNKGGKHETPDCKATVSGNTLTVVKSGGVGNHVSWSVRATDGVKTETKNCGVCVENPGKGGVCKAGWVPGTLAPCPGL